MENRRRFIRQLTVAGLAGTMAVPGNAWASGPFTQKAGRKKEAARKLACWCRITRDFDGTDDQVKRQLDQTREAGIDILYNFFGSTISFDQGPEAGGAEERNFYRMLNFAHERGIKVEPLIRAREIKQQENAHGILSSEWKRRSYNSGQPGGHKHDGNRLCLSWKENRDAEVKMVENILKHYPVDGIHLDYIRYTDTGNSLKWPCRCEACQNEYQYLFGKPIITDEDLEIPGMLMKFLNFRGKNIRSLVENMKAAVDKAGLPLSMAARAGYFDTALVEGQDWVQWAREGLMDTICTMNYTTDRDRHRLLASEHLTLVGNAAPIYDGIGRRSSLGENSTREMLQKAEDALELGASGISIFSYGALTDEDFRELGAFKRANLG